MITLMYHGIISGNAQVPPDREPGAELYDVVVEDFREQMEYLKNYNYLVTTFDNSGKLNDPSKNVIITFDDGEMNNFKSALPVLKEFGYPAYFFVTVKRIGRPGYMGWEELKRLRDMGMVIGSHGLNHEILIDLNDKKLEQELAESKAILEQHLKINIEDFSVPRGFYNERILEKARQAGYRNIFVSGKAKGQAISRVAVKGNWTVRRFDQALRGRVPVGEGVFNLAKGTVKRLLASGGYDRVRGGLLGIKNRFKN